MDFLKRLPQPLASLLVIVATLLAGTAGGYAARFVHLPLPWLLGSMFTIMALSLLGTPVRLIPWGRAAGQVVIGAATGLQFTGSVLAHLIVLLPLMVGVAFVATLVGAIGGLILIRLSGIDATTAFFATVPGGIVETSNLAPRYGAQLEPIMVGQTARVALIVMFAPFLVISFTGAAATNPLLAVPVVPWIPILLTLAAAGAAGIALSATRSPNAWLIGPLAVAGLASAFGLVEGRAPDLLLTAAQVVLGSALGAQFRREFVTRLFRIFLASSVVVLFAAGTMVAFGVLVAWLLAYPVPTMVLSLAPAGMAEMMLTGKLLGLDSTMIAGFQLVRILFVLIWCRTALRLFERLAVGAVGSKPPSGST